jgi:hypothetical protein
VYEEDEEEQHEEEGDEEEVDDEGSTRKSVNSLSGRADVCGNLATRPTNVQ